MLKRFLGIKIYKKNWKKVTQHVGTRISAQVRSHAQKVLLDYSPNYLPENSCSIQEQDLVLEASNGDELFSDTEEKNLPGLN